MSVCVVTGYVPLPCDHRTRERYNELGGRLLDACPRSVLFRNKLEDCWLAKRIGNVAPGGKDTVAYHCVQHQKFAWLEGAAMAADAATLIWIDYGILHLTGVTPELVVDFVQRVEADEPEVIVAPSGGDYGKETDTINWLFLGGIVVVPAEMAAWLMLACQQAVEPVAWEVNTLARVSRKHPEMFRMYAANHNPTMFENYGRWHDASV